MADDANEENEMRLDIAEELYAINSSPTGSKNPVYHLILAEDLHDELVINDVGQMHREDLRGYKMASFGETPEDAKEISIPTLCRFDAKGKYAFVFEDWMLPGMCKLCVKKLRRLVEGGEEEYLKHSLEGARRLFEEEHGIAD